MKKRVINFGDRRLSSGQESGDLSLPPGQEDGEGGIFLSKIPHLLWKWFSDISFFEHDNP
jgi:hypothetical protein